MAFDEYKYTTPFTGSDVAYTTSATVAAGEKFEKLTPLGQVETTGELKAYNPTATDGTNKAVFMSAYDIDATNGAEVVAVYKCGTFNSHMINWPKSTTAAQKATAFTGTPISHQTPIND
ncbi:MAG: head decoration protein [Flavobacteriales bacterium]